jgi:hypothetical protein
LLLLLLCGVELEPLDQLAWGTKDFVPHFESLGQVRNKRAAGETSGNTATISLFTV